MAEAGGVPFSLDRDELRVDARPARLVAQLDRTLTVHTATGASTEVGIGDAARRVACRLTDSFSVEATPAAELVAAIDGAGRALVVNLNGDVTVVPDGDGDRFALAPHEAFVLAAGDDPRIVATGSLAAGDQELVAAVLDGTAQALFAPAPPAEAPRPAPAPAKAKKRPAAKKAAAKKAAAPAPVAKAEPAPPPPPAPVATEPHSGHDDEEDHREEAYADTPTDHRIVLAMILLGLVLTVIAVLLLTAAA